MTKIWKKWKINNTNVKEEKVCFVNKINNNNNYENEIKNIFLNEDERRRDTFTFLTQKKNHSSSFVWRHYLLFSIHSSIIVTISNYHKKTKKLNWTELTEAFSTRKKKKRNSDFFLSYVLCSTPSQNNVKFVGFKFPRF